MEWASVGGGVVAAVVGFLIALETVQRWSEPNYAMPGWVVAVAALCALAALAGAWLLLRHPAGSSRSWLTLLTALLLLFGVLTIFSVGLGLLIVAAGCLVVRIRLSRRSPTVGRSAGVGAGLLLAVGLVPLSALAISSPVVACTSDGVETSVPMWIWLGPVSGSSRSGANGLSVRGDAGPSGGGESSGRVSVGGVSYTYSCQGDRLTNFATR
ncbi:MAG: hypothetical protein ACRENX_05875 [Candidatus Dormibacteria bacterium]